MIEGTTEVSNTITKGSPEDTQNTPSPLAISCCSDTGILATVTCHHLRTANLIQSFLQTLPSQQPALRHRVSTADPSAPRPCDHHDGNGVTGRPARPCLHRTVSKSAKFSGVPRSSTTTGQRTAPRRARPAPRTHSTCAHGGHAGVPAAQPPLWSPRGEQL